MKNLRLNEGDLNTAFRIKSLLWLIVVFELFISYTIFLAIFVRHDLPLSYLYNYVFVLVFPLFLWGSYQIHKPYYKLFEILSLLAFTLMIVRIFLILITLITGKLSIFMQDIFPDSLFILMYFYIGKFFRNISKN